MEEVDVAQLVLRAESEEGYRYFLAKRTSDGYWEWIGGKVEQGEAVEEAAERELKEEIQIDWDTYSFSIESVAESYPSDVDSKYLLNPVMIEIGPETAENIEEQHLSCEHDELTWIKLTEFDKYESLGQYRALERLDLVEGDVALAAVRNDEEYLVVQRSEENTSSGRWGFVSGKLEDGEVPEEAAVREVKEEVNIDAEVIDSGDFYIGEGELGYWRLFPILLETESLEVELNWELSDHRWIDLDKIRDMKTMGRLKAVHKLDLV